MQPTKVGSLLASDAGLQPVIAKARQISALSKLVVDFLPPGLARLVRAINLHERPGDRQLVLLAASPAAAAKLKLLAEALRQHLSELRAEVNSVSVRVQPDAGTVAQVTSRAAPRLTPAVLKELQALHARLPDSAARRSLKTLLDHHLKR